MSDVHLLAVRGVHALEAAGFDDGQIERMLDALSGVGLTIVPARSTPAETLDPRDTLEPTMSDRDIVGFVRTIWRFIKERLPHNREADHE